MAKRQSPRQSSPSSLRGAKRRGNPVRSIRRVAPLIKRGGRSGTPVHSPPPKKTASICSVWKELDCHVASLLAMTSSSEGFPPSDELPSPACGGGRPKGGRGFPTIRRAAPLIKRGRKERDACPFPTAKEISVASLRMEGTGLPRRCAPRNDEVGRAFAMTRAGGFRNDAVIHMSSWRANIPPSIPPQPEAADLFPQWLDRRDMFANTRRIVRLRGLLFFIHLRRPP
jgi:hypothetical protein